MSSYLVITPDGQTYGPAQESDLAAWVSEKRISADTVLSRCDGGARLVARDFPSLGFPPIVPQRQMNYPAALTVHPPTPQFAHEPVGPTLNETPVVLMYLLSFLTLGIYPFFHINLMHGRLPRLRHNDPSGGAAVGFHFIPFFNIYWAIFVQLRLVDRINEQRAFAGLPPSSVRGFLITTIVFHFIPVLNLAGPVLMLTYYGWLQAAVNELVRCRCQGL